MSAGAIEVQKPTCPVAKCPEPVFAKGLCRKHWERQHKHGTTDDPEPRTGARNPAWKGATATYSAVHLRMSNGPRPGNCEKCGTTEGRFEWALREDVPTAALLYSTGGYAYSPDPAHYANLCKTCHNKQDLGSDVCDRGHLVVGDNAYIQPSTGKRFCRECARIRRRQRHEATPPTESALARAWAISEGIPVNKQGRISIAVLTAYRWALEHGKAA